MFFWHANGGYFNLQRIQFALVNHPRRRHLPQSWEHLQKTSLSEEATLRKWDAHRNPWQVQDSRLPLGVAARLSGENRVFIQRHLCQAVFLQKYQETTFPLISCCHHPQKSLTLKGPFTPRVSKRLNQISPWCAQASLWLKIISCLYWAEQPPHVAMLICTCAYGDARDTHST